MIDYSHIILQAYREILLREADPSGLAHYNQLMNEDPSFEEADLRNALRTSAEYRQRFGTVDPPQPTPGGPMALKVSGNQFLLQDGTEVRLLGIAGVCCTEEPVNFAKQCQWPLTDEDVLRALSQVGGNYHGIRLGPYVADGQGGKQPQGNGEGPGFSAYATIGQTPSGHALYDLDHWDEDFWGKVHELCVQAKSLGIYVGVDMLDDWARRNAPALDTSPYRSDRNVQGEDYTAESVVLGAPPIRFQFFAREVVHRLGDLDNVLFTLGNENFISHASAEYEGGLVAIIREAEQDFGFAPHMIGTNVAEGTSQPPYANYLTFETNDPQAPTTCPALVVEYSADNLTPEAFAKNAAAMDRWRAGGFMLWMGQQQPGPARPTDPSADPPDPGVFSESLRLMGQIIAGTREPVPDVCPSMVQIKAGIFQSLGPDGHPLPDKNKPVAGGFVRLDTTPIFDGPCGHGPCNAEHDNCCGRVCEDPRGWLWAMVKSPGPTTWHVTNPGPDSGYSVSIGGIPRRGGIALKPGDYTFECKPHPDAHDGEYPPKPLSFPSGLSARVSFTVA